MFLCVRNIENCLHGHGIFYQLFPNWVFNCYDNYTLFIFISHQRKVIVTYLFLFFHLWVCFLDSNSSKKMGVIKQRSNCLKIGHVMDKNREDFELKHNVCFSTQRYLRKNYWICSHISILVYWKNKQTNNNSSKFLTLHKKYSVRVPQQIDTLHTDLL